MYNNSLSGINRSACTLYVPQESVDLYWLHPEWEDFFDIKGIEPSVIKSTPNDVHSVPSYYTLDGKKIDAPKKGLNIIKMNNGSYKKIIIK